MWYCFGHDIFKVTLRSGKVACPRCEIQAGRAVQVGPHTARILETR